MPNMLRDGLAFLTQQLADNAAEDITYRRGSDSVQVRAVIGRKLLRIEDADGGIRVELTDVDACIPTDGFSFDGGATRITPERGDLIELTLPYDVQTFEVLPLGREPAWRWSDPIGQTMVRVHAKHIDTEQFA